MKSTVYVWMLLVGLSTVTLGHHTGSDHNDTSLAASKVKTSLIQFSLNLYKQLAKVSGNNFFSPISIAASLSALSLGARSTTRTQILEGLGFNVSEIQDKKIHEGFHDAIHGLSRASDQIQIDQGQALFLRENVTFKQTFLDDVHAFYEADITSAKFQETKEAKKQINDYMERETRGKITQVVKDLDLTAINYISFQGNWKKPFNPELTKEEDFFVDEKTTIKVPMMFGTGWFDFYIDVERSCTVLRLDYNSSASALFVLPEHGKEKQLEEALTLDTLTEWQRRVQRGVADVYLPKFKISTSHSLKEPLRNLHITDVFSDSADLSGITETIPLKLSKVIHNAVLSIDERGTAASTAPAEEAVPMAMPPTIVFERPFLMVIQMSATILYTGKIVYPKMQ